MSYEIRTHPGMTVVGVSQRALNANEMAGKGVIGPTWERFMREGLHGRIPGAEPAIIAAYLDYESDHQGWYTFLLGAAVPAPATAPTGMSARPIEAGRFAVFQAPTPQSIPGVWGEIWGAGLSRAFTSDFEVHPGPGRPSEIYVRLK